MRETIFFSWQLDTDKKTGKYFLQDVFKDACTQLSEEPEFVEADRGFEADSDTQDAPGQPHIAETILKKIGEASIFAADLTYIGASDSGKKRLPNPNVLLEYGWALKAHGAGRIVSVMNVAYGDPETFALPFDLAHYRWPIRFNLPADADKPTIKKVHAELVGNLKKALQAQLKHGDKQREASVTKHVAREPQYGRARFRRQDQIVGSTMDMYSAFPINGVKKVLFAPSQPTIYLRLIPERPILAPLKEDQMHEAAFQTAALRLQPFTWVGEINRLRAEDGIGICWGINGDNQTESVAFAFEDGEIWSTDAAILRAAGPTLPAFEIEKAFVEGMSNYLAFLRQLDLKGNYRWIAGIEGVSGRKFFYSAQTRYQGPHYGRELLADAIEVDGVVSTDTTDTRKALAPFFSRIYQKCGLEYSAPQQA